MINRVLIRIKVVQLLYSYLLTKSEFRMESLPESPTRERRFAYSIYGDTLLFILQLSGVEVSGAGRKPLIPEATRNKYLPQSKLMRALVGEEKVRLFARKECGEGLSGAFGKCAAVIYDSLLKSTPYRSYIRLKEKDVKNDVALWTSVIRNILAKDENFVACARELPDFSLSGFEKGLEMAAATLESYSDSRSNLAEARNALDRSLDKAYELYHALLLLPVEITRMQDQKLDAAKHKYLPTPEDLNPDMRFVDNALPKLISESEGMKEYLKKNPVSWVDDDTLIRKLLELVVSSQIYKDYMAAESTDREADCELWRSLLKNIILPSDELAEALESKSVYWNDDLDIMSTFVLKTIKRIGSSSGEVKLLPQYKDDEDARFGAELFMDVVRNLGEYRSLIDRFINSEQWDPERLAFMDGVIMLVAVAELLNYPAIPLAVTLNEYIEIANSYSTPRSGAFVNGILHSVIMYLKEEGKLTKE